MRVKTDNGAVANPAVVLPVQMTQKRMTLEAITENEQTAGEKIVLYAPEGWGKNTWAAHSKNPVFLSTEDGMKGIEVDGKKPKKFPDPQTWQDVFDAIETLRTQSHDFETLVIDTLDWTEHLCHAFLCKRDNKDSIEDYGYGKGYVISFEEWKRLLSPLDCLRKEKRMDIIFLAHCAIRTFNNPSGENYDRYEMKVHKAISSLIKEWSDCILFGNYDVAVDVKKGQSKGKAYGGERVLYTSHSAAFDAKNRYSLPEIMPVPKESPAKAFWDHINGGK